MIPREEPTSAPNNQTYVQKLHMAIDPFYTETPEGDLYTCKEDIEHKLGNSDDSIPLGVGLLEKTTNETQTNYKNQRVLIFGREFFKSSTTYLLCTIS